MKLNKRILLSVIAFSTMAMGASKAQIAEWDEALTEIEETQQEIAKHDGDDNLKWGVDFRTAYNSIGYDMANGDTFRNDKLMTTRLWLTMKYAFNEKSRFIGSLSMNKTFGADFQGRAFSPIGNLDWTSNEVLSNSSIRLRSGYWLYEGDNAFGAGLPWSASIGRRPSVGTFLSSLSQDDEPASSLGHVMNAHVDALSLKLKLEDLTGVPGMGLKFCAGIGSTNAEPLFTTATPYAYDEDALSGVQMSSVEFQIYDDSRFIVKSQWYIGLDLGGFDLQPNFTDSNGNVVDPSLATNLTYESTGIKAYGDLQGFAFSALIDGITDEGYFSDAKVFGSFGLSKSEPYEGKAMLGSTESEVGTSYWVGTYLPVGEEALYGTVGFEYNHGDKYWRPFTYAEDTMVGSKIATRGDAFEANYTYNITEALSLQARYVKIDYDYIGTNSMFGNYAGREDSIGEIKDKSNQWDHLSGGADPTSIVAINDVASQLGGDTVKANDLAIAANMTPYIVESAQDFRFYLRYRF